LTAQNQLTINEAHHLLTSKQISSLELTRSALERIRQVEPQIHALVTVTEEQAFQQARHADQLIAEGKIAR